MKTLNTEYLNFLIEHKREELIAKMAEMRHRFKNDPVFKIVSDYTDMSLKSNFVFAPTTAILSATIFRDLYLYDPVWLREFLDKNRIYFITDSRKKLRGIVETYENALKAMEQETESLAEINLSELFDEIENNLNGKNKFNHNGEDFGDPQPEY